ncbi:hypothetical protein [Paeniglutamicibacter psychrophenolicus]|uniref:hypothetical protein n=1 Tax=Paeniglutamicibacter psychrophenolicus TaxID=257454 RepID=UPI002781A023|nr:hypothetical protein [Paeniglutamicibacter psychrophenolicus]MDQ0096008.1 hypothetical protein [Paeniglutamicibacter psychrophenolicus]
MSTTPRKEELVQAGQTPQGARDASGGKATADGTVDPFQDPEMLAARLPDGEALVPGAADGSGSDGSDTDRFAADRPAGSPGSNSADEDADRFDAG